MARHYLNLPSVTLVSATGVDPRKNIRALEISKVDIKFGDVVLLSRIVPRAIPNGIRFEQVMKHSGSYDEFSRFVMFDLYKYINTEFALLVHHRATVLRPSSWINHFLDYDYIGAPWRPGSNYTNSGREVLVGNGGFSLRSQKIMRAPTVLSLPFTDNGTGYFHEDGQLCNYHRDALEIHGVRFAPVEIAAKFSTETWIDGAARAPFGYHNSRSAKPILFDVRNKLKRI